jgi:FlaA1/EpsC-like NDP-sugar epimerase
VRKLIALGRGENSLHPLIIQYEKDARFSYCIADVQDRFKLDFVMRSEKPDVIFHAAAHKHVPIMEEFPEEAVKNNIFGTYNAAKAALENDVENFILVSTDKAVNPTSLMGATKKIAEKLILSLNGKGKTRFLCTRFGNVLGSRGSVIPTFLQQIRKGGPVTITHPDMERYFMSIPEAARLVIKSPSAREGHIFVLNMGNPVKITTLAENLIKLTGHSPGEIPIVYTGLRKGEKLYEELFGNEEPLVPTRFEKLMAATGKEELFSEETLQSLLEEFAEAAREVDRGRIRELVKKYLPRFQGSEKRVSG